MRSDREILEKTYAAFNARELEAVLALMDPDVDWPNGWEGGRVNGREGIRDYWTRQWAAIDPQVEPVGFQADVDNRTIVTVHQVVRDRAGNVLADETVRHVYVIRDGLIKSMDIEK
jgi:ketosteroid isomerase-like protein